MEVPQYPLFGVTYKNIDKSMASTSGWFVDGTIGTVGNNQGSNNGSGFMALPGGVLLNRIYYAIVIYNDTYSYSGLGSWCVFSCISSYYKDDQTITYHCYLKNNSGDLSIFPGNVESGVSVRCLKD